MKNFVLTNSELENLCESVYNITSQIENFPVVKKEYNSLKKYSIHPTINDILNHAEMVYGDSIKGNLVENQKKGAEDFTTWDIPSLDFIIEKSLHSFD